MRKKLFLGALTVVVLGLAGLWWALVQVENRLESLRDDPRLRFEYSHVERSLHGVVVQGVQFSTPGIAVANAHMALHLRWSSVFGWLPRPGLLLEVRGARVRIEDRVSGGSSGQPRQSSDSMAALEPQIERLRTLLQSRWMPFLAGVRLEDLHLELPQSVQLAGLDAELDTGLSVQARTRIQHPRLPGEDAFFELVGRVELAEPRLQIERALLQMDGASTTARGQLDLAGPALQGTLAAHGQTQRTGGRLRADWNLGGAWEHPRLEGELDLRELRALRAQQPDMHGEFAGNLHNLDVRIWRADRPDELRLDLQVPLDGTPLDFALRYRDLRLRDYLYTQWRYLGFDRISGIATGQCDLRDLSATGVAEASFAYLPFRDPLVASARSRISYRDGELHFTEGQVRGEALQAQASGWLDLRNSEEFFHLDASAQIADVRRWAEPFWTRVVDGELNADVRIRGHEQRPRVEFDFHTDSLEVLAASVDRVQGQVHVLPEPQYRVWIPRLSAQVAGGQLDLDSAEIVPQRRDAWLDIPFRGRNMNLQHGLDFAGVDVDLRLDVPVEQIEGRVRGLATDPHIQGRARAARGRVWELHTPPARVDAGLAAGIVWLVARTDDNDQATLTFDLDSDLRGAARLRSVDVGDWYPLPGDSLDLHIDDLHLDLSGQWSDPHLQAQLRGVRARTELPDSMGLDVLAEAQVQLNRRELNVQFPQMRVREPLSADVLRPELRWEFAHQRQWVQGTLLSEYGALETRMEFREQQLSEVQAEGRVDLQAIAALSGGQLLGQGAMDIRLAGNQSFAGDLRFDPDAELVPAGQPQLRIRGLEARLGYDRASGEGRIADIQAQVGRSGQVSADLVVDWLPGSDPVYALAADIRSLLLRLDDSVVLADVRGAVQGQGQQAPSWYGQIDLLRGRVVQGAADVEGVGEGASQGGILPGNGWVQLRTRNPVEISTGPARLRLQMDLVVFNDAAGLGIDGRAQATGGTVDINGREFRVLRGELVFPGTLVPELDMDLETRIQNYRVLVRVGGTAENMSLQFSSVPALSRDQIVNLLVLGSPAAGGESLAASSVVAERFAEGLNRLSSSLIGQGLFKVASERTFGQSDLALSQEISPRLEFQLARGLGIDAAQELVVLYRLFDTLVLRAYRQMEGSMGLNVEYRFGP